MIKTWKSPDGTSFSVCPTCTCGRPTITPTGINLRCCARCLYHPDTDWAQREEDERQRLVARSRCETSCLVNGIEVNLTPWPDEERPATGKEFLGEVARSGLTAESCDRMGPSAELSAGAEDEADEMSQMRRERDEAIADCDFFDEERQALVDQIEGDNGLLARCEALAAEAVRLREERDARGSSAEPEPAERAKSAGPDEPPRSAESTVQRYWRIEFEKAERQFKEQRERAEAAEADRNSWQRATEELQRELVDADARVKRAEDEAATLRSALECANEAAAQRSRAADAWAERAEKAEATIASALMVLKTVPYGSSEMLEQIFNILVEEAEAEALDAVPEQKPCATRAPLEARTERLAEAAEHLVITWDKNSVLSDEVTDAVERLRAALADTPAPEPGEGE